MSRFTAQDKAGHVHDFNAIKAGMRMLGLVWAKIFAY